MSKIIYHLLFLFISIYILLKTIGYGIYEIKVIKNKSAGIIVIVFSILTVIFSNTLVWLN